MQQSLFYQDQSWYDATKQKLPYSKNIMSLETKSIYVNISLFKKSFDILFSTLLIVFIFSWLFPLVSLVIKFTSKGPVFFVQERIGLNGSVFKCIKFRTMKVNKGKDEDTPLKNGDIRITPVGAFLRKTSLDELPQFFNVLLGDMSIVGPRPHAIAFHQSYAAFVENIDYRHLVKPGITGLAQVRGYRGDIKDFEVNKYRTIKRINADIMYINSWSFGLDLRIVYTTFIQIILKRA